MGMPAENSRNLGAKNLIVQDGIWVGQTPVALEGHTHSPVTALGIATVPSLAGSAQATVQVTIKPTLADATYTAAAVLTGSVSLLASLSVLSTTVVPASRVDVVVKNTGLITLSGGQVIVNAVHG